MKNKNIGRMVVKALRHCPDMLELEVDKAGYCSVQNLIASLHEHGYKVSADDIEEIGKNERISFNENHTRIRVDYGNSIGLKLSDMYEKSEAPPTYLYHGTSKNVVSAIRENGILRVPAKEGSKARDHVFLTESQEIAFRKGNRHGESVVLRVNALEMHNAGYEFYHAKNDIWLTDHIPPQFIEYNF